MKKEIGICSLRDQGVAGMVEDILRQSGIHPRPLNTAAHFSVGGAAQSYDLWVPEEEEDAAREILTAAGYQNDLVSR